jgi:hypothetical protein
MAIKTIINPKEKNKVMFIELEGMKNVKKIISTVSKYPKSSELFFLIKLMIRIISENTNVNKENSGMVISENLIDLSKVGQIPFDTPDNE